MSPSKPRAAYKNKVEAPVIALTQFLQFNPESVAGTAAGSHFRIDRLRVSFIPGASATAGAHAADVDSSRTQPPIAAAAIPACARSAVPCRAA